MNTYTYAVDCFTPIGIDHEYTQHYGPSICDVVPHCALRGIRSCLGATTCNVPSDRTNAKRIRHTRLRHNVLSDT